MDHDYQSRSSFVNYEPVEVNNVWHAAYRTPGVEGVWTSLAQCPDEASAKTSCHELNAASAVTQRQLTEDLRLRGGAV